MCSATHIGKGGFNIHALTLLQVLLGWRQAPLQWLGL